MIAQQYKFLDRKITYSQICGTNWGTSYKNGVYAILDIKLRFLANIENFPCLIIKSYFPSDNFRGIRQTILNSDYFTHKFLLDSPTPGLIQENEIHHDIFFLNSTFTGKAKAEFDIFSSNNLPLGQARILFWTKINFAQQYQKNRLASAILNSGLRGLAKSF